MLAQRRSGMRPRKAWGATTRAMDALVLARTGDEPERTAQTSTEPRHLEGLDGDVRQTRLVARYYTRQGGLHGDCFYLGLCEPLSETERRIRETAEYIDDAERLATGSVGVSGILGCTSRTRRNLYEQRAWQATASGP